MVGQLHGEKGSTWEGGVRVPLAVRWPAGVAAPPTRPRPDPVSLLDVAPTVYELAGVAPRLPLDGASLLAPADPGRCFFHWREAALYALRCGPWKAHMRTRPGFGFEPPKSRYTPISWRLVPCCRRHAFDWREAVRLIEEGRAPEAVWYAYLCPRKQSV